MITYIIKRMDSALEFIYICRGVDRQMTSVRSWTMRKKTGKSKKKKLHTYNPYVNAFELRPICYPQSHQLRRRPPHRLYTYTLSLSKPLTKITHLKNVHVSLPVIHHRPTARTGATLAPQLAARTGPVLSAISSNVSHTRSRHRIYIAFRL